MPTPMTQVECWNGPVGERWVAEQEALDHALAPFGDAVLASAALRPGESVLDVGCGCGGATLAAAEAVGPTGSVLGVDVSAPMIARARQRAAGLPQLDFELADASTHPFSKPVDVLVSRFGVMFFADPVAAFTHLRAALRSSGRLAFVCWRPASESRWVQVPLQAASKHLPVDPPGDPDAPGPFSFGQAERVRRILGAAGFSGVEVLPLDADLVLSTTGLDAATRFATSTGPTSRLLSAAEEGPAKARAIAEVSAALALHEKNGTVALPAAAWVVTARR